MIETTKSFIDLAVNTAKITLARSCNNCHHQTPTASCSSSIPSRSPSTPSPSSSSSSEDRSLCSSSSPVLIKQRSWSSRRGPSKMGGTTLIFSLLLLFLIHSASSLPITEDYEYLEDSLPSTAASSTGQSRTKRSVGNWGTHRNLYVINYKTGKFLHVSSKGVSESDKKNDPTNVIVRAPAGDHAGLRHVSLQGQSAKKFICMNRKGKVIVKAHFRKDRCSWHQELIAGLHTVYEFMGKKSKRDAGLQWYLSVTSGGKVRKTRKKQADGTKFQEISIETP